MNVFDLVAKLTLDTSEYESTLKEASETGLGKFGSSATAAGKAMLPATAAIAGLGTASVMTAANFEAAMSSVAAISGATGDDLTALTNKAQEMGANTRFTASQAAEALTYMAMAGWKTDDMLGGLEGIMSLAAASGEDLGTTSDIVTDALTAFGLSASDSGHFADVLAAASSNANTNVSMMGETFKYAAPLAGAMGFSIEDTANAIGLMANAGIKGSQAGTSLRRIFTALSGEVKISGAAIGDVTIATQNADGSMKDLSEIMEELRGYWGQLTEAEQASAATSIAGQNAMSGFLALMNAAPEDVDKLTSAIENCDGAAGDMSSTMQDNLSGELTIMKSQLEGVAIAFGKTLAPAVTAVVKKIQKFLDWLNSLDEGQRKVIVTIGLVVAAIGPLLIFIGKVATGINALLALAPLITAGMSGFIAAAAPVIAIILAVVAAIVAVIAIIKNWGAIQDWLDEKLEGFFDFLTGFAEEIVNVITEMGDAIVEFITNFMESAWEVWSEIFEKMHQFLVNTWENIKSAVSSAIDAVKTIITDVLTSIKDFFVDTWENIKTGITDAWTNMKEAISDKVSDIKEAITSGIQKAIDWILDLPSQALQWGKDLIDSFVQGIKDRVGAVVDAVEGVANEVKDFLGFSEPKKGPLSNFHTFAPDMIDLFTSGIYDNMREITNASEQLASAMSPEMPTYEGTVSVAAASTGEVGGDIIIPVYIGQSRIDEILVSSEQVRNYRSGGR